MGGGIGAIIGLCWIGACCGSLAGILVASTFGVLTGMFAARESIPGGVVAVGAIGGLASILFWQAARYLPADLAAVAE